MTADDDVRSQHPSPQQRALRLDDIDLDRFLVEADAAMSIGALTEAFRHGVERAGFTRAHYAQLVSMFRRQSAAMGERVLIDLDAASGGPKSLAGLDMGPVVTRKFALLRVHTWQELIAKCDPNAESRTPLDAYRRAGFVDGVTVPVSLHEGDIAAFVFLKAHTIHVLSRPATHKLQFFCQAMHARYSALAPENAGTTLSKREAEVMRLVAVGRTNADIAGELEISVHTVNTLVRRCFAKLGVSNRVEASARIAYLTRGK